MTDHRNLGKLEDFHNPIRSLNRNHFLLIAQLEYLEEHQVWSAIPTVGIITTDPDESMAQIHPRQPAILEQRDYEEWLRPSERPPLHLLRILPSEEMNVQLLDTHSVQLPLFLPLHL